LRGRPRSSCCMFHRRRGACVMGVTFHASGSSIYCMEIECRHHQQFRVHCRMTLNPDGMDKSAAIDCRGLPSEGESTWRARTISLAAQVLTSRLRIIQTDGEMHVGGIGRESAGVPAPVRHHARIQQILYRCRLGGNSMLCRHGARRHRGTQNSCLCASQARGMAALLRIT